MEIIAVACVLVLVVWLAYEWGRRDQEKERTAREEAIRLSAYQAGSEAMADHYRRLMNKTEWDAGRKTMGTEEYMDACMGRFDLGDDKAKESS